MLPVAILAGGLATRLHPVTQKIPKALVDVNGEPFVFHQLRLLQRRGIRRVVLCLGYLGQQVVDAVRDGAQFGIDVGYSFDGPQLLGTGGALTQALPLLGREFFVLYGDSYLDCDYAGVERAYFASGKPALMTVFRNEGQWDSSNVEYADGRIVAYSKTERTPRMRHIDYGLGVLSADLFQAVGREQPTDLATIYTRLAATAQLAAFEVTQRFYEIGSFAGLQEFERFLGRENP